MGCGKLLRTLVRISGVPAEIRLYDLLNTSEGYHYTNLLGAMHEKLKLIKNFF
jgi:hypothetical protein